MITVSANLGANKGRKVTRDIDAISNQNQNQQLRSAHNGNEGNNTLKKLARDQRL